MKNELADRQQAGKLRLAGKSAVEICQVLGRSRDWFHTWWRRYRALGSKRRRGFAKRVMTKKQVTSSWIRIVQWKFIGNGLPPRAPQRRSARTACGDPIG